MKLKTLLLGSAAAMIAVTGARAADAVIVEPEPVEYVRVCDLYGSGFHYIPGTETCLNFNGYVRIDYTYNDFDAAGVSDSDQWQYRARFNIDARNETDFGTLRSQIRFQADGNGGSNTLGFAQSNNPITGAAVAGSVAQGDAFVGVDRALISLGGLRMGYSDSYTTTVHGYGLPVEKYDGYYGYDQAIFLDYTFAVAGFSVTAGVQDSRGPQGDLFLANGTLVRGAGDYIDAEFYVGAAYSGDLFGAAISYLYEDAADNGVLKVSANVNPFDGFTVSGFYLTDDLGDSNRPTRGLQGNGDYSWGVGASYQFLDTMALRAGYTDADSAEAYAVVGLNWTPVSGLAVRPEVQLREDTGQSYSLRVYRTF